MARKNRKMQRLRVVNPDCAGIDIGKDRHFVAVDPARSSEPVRAFDCFTRDLQAMSDWLSSCGVTTVAMESTSVYWIPVYEVLERAGFEVLLVPPRMTKQIAGRKSDVLDCQWIWQLLSYGLLRGAFRPGDAVCPLRSYVRQMKRLTEDRSRSVQHMQKALTEMNVRLDSVIADITGQTGMKILRAIVDGERDPQRLASFRHRGIKASADAIATSLEGTWREEHLFAVEQAMQRYDCPLRSYVRQMKRLTEDRSRSVQHMQKALTEMNVRLDSVIADITGQTGMKILRAIVDGERDPQRLASFRHRGIKASADAIATSLEGTWREEHLFAVEQAMQRYDFLDRQIEDCEARIAEQIDLLTPPDGSEDNGASDDMPPPGADGAGPDTASHRGGGRRRAMHDMRGAWR